MGVLDRLLNPSGGAKAQTKAAIVKMAAECGLREEDAREYASEHDTVESASAALIRFMAMNIGGEELTASEVEAVVEHASTPLEAKTLAADKVIMKRQAAEGPETVPSMGGANGVGHSWDHGDGFQAKMIDGLRARVNPKHEPTSGREAANFTMVDLARACLASAGKTNVIGGPARVIEMAASHSQSDFPLILEGTIGREAAQAYNQQLPALMEVAHEISASDFRLRTRPRLSTGPQLEHVPEAAEITYGSFKDGGEYQPQVAPYAKLFNLSRHAIVNDDLSMFAQIPQEMARGSISTVRSLLVAPLVANSGAGQTMRDGVALFHADHGNLAASGGAISVTSVNVATTAMQRQTGLVGEIIDIRPTVIVVPPERQTDAQQLVAQNTPTTLEEVNPFAGSLRVLVEPALTDTNRWYIAADPTRSEGLAYSYLDGERVPRVTSSEVWNIQGMSWKCELDFGAAFVDHRSWYANDGA